ncbi:Rv0361 family membrane protein [Mycolicibacterium sp. A43C]
MTRLVVVLICMALSTVGCARSTTGTAAAPADVQPWSTEAQIVELVQEFESAWNTSDFDGLRQLMCADLLAQDVFTDDELQEARADGTLDLSILELEVEDSGARAVIENHGADADEIAFVREGGRWKWCEY